MPRSLTIAWIFLFVLAHCCVLAQGVLQTGGASAPSAPRSRTAALASDIKASALWDGREEVEFHSISSPKMVKASEAHFLIDDEYVLGITEDGESRAYPTRFASWHHIINDRIGKKDKGEPKFVTVTYCIVCNSGMRFDTPLVHNEPLIFDFYGLYNGVMTMYDRSTQSVWLQVEGRAVKGPLLGSFMKQGPIMDTTWRQWKKLHPDTLVMAPDRRSRAFYERKGSVMVRGYDRFPANYFRPTVTHRDARLPMFESVLACNIPLDYARTGARTAGNSHLHRAYPIKVFKRKTGVVNDSIGGSPIAILFLADSETITAVSRNVAGRTLTLETRRGLDGERGFYDRETGTRWNIEGLAEEGPLKGKLLSRIDSHLSQWYGWVSYFPDTSIYGQSASHEIPAAGAGARPLLASRHSH